MLAIYKHRFPVIKLRVFVIVRCKIIAPAGNFFSVSISNQSTGNNHDSGNRTGDRRVKVNFGASLSTGSSGGKSTKSRIDPAKAGHQEGGVYVGNSV